MRFLHRREPAPALLLRAVLHRPRQPARLACGLYGQSTGAWVAQQARNLGLDFSNEGVRFLLRDRDSKYSRPFDEVFRSEGIRIVKTPLRAPKAKATAERFVRTVRSECLDWPLISNRRHESVLLCGREDADWVAFALAMFGAGRELEPGELLGHE